MCLVWLYVLILVLRLDGVIVSDMVHFGEVGDSRVTIYAQGVEVIVLVLTSPWTSIAIVCPIAPLPQ